MFNTASARVAAAFTLLLLHAEDLRTADREEGQALVEYGLILALIAVFCVAAIGFIGDDIKSALESIAEALPGG